MPTSGQPRQPKGAAWNGVDATGGGLGCQGQQGRTRISGSRSVVTFATELGRAFLDCARQDPEPIGKPFLPPSFEYGEP